MCVSFTLRSTLPFKMGCVCEAERERASVQSDSDGAGTDPAVHDTEASRRVIMSRLHLP